MKATSPLTWVVAAALYLILSGGGMPSLPSLHSLSLPSRPSAAVCEQTGQLSERQMHKVAARAGFDGYERRVAVAVAGAESGWRQDAVGDGGYSIGPWQIHMPSHPEYSRADLMNPCRNAEAAEEISSHGRGWENWTQYRNGEYRRFMR